MFRTLALCCLLPAMLLGACQARAADPALRTLTSRHLTLVTDLPPDAEVDALPGYFDQAFAQWCDYFGLDPRQHADWHVRGFLMQSRPRFDAAGLISDQVPEFATGYSLGDACWLFDQTSVYYRRHLLLHEGTHCFMNTLLGGTGPSWYTEGTAELLATHRLDAGRLLLNQMPANADEVPKWGRIEAVRTDFEQHRALTLDKIFRLGGTLHGTVEQYGWCWAAAVFLDHHPRYRERFRQLSAWVGRGDFDERLVAALAEDRQRLDEDWQIFIANLDYGYDFQRMDVDRVAGVPLAGPAQAAGPAQVIVAADRGWQSSGVAVTAGQKLQLRASGRYQLTAGARPWVSEPGGVTIQYYDDQPLGILLAAVRSDDDAASSKFSGLIRPIVVGLATTVAAPRTGTLYFRINDSAGSLSDNGGALEVQISAAP